MFVFSIVSFCVWQNGYHFLAPPPPTKCYSFFIMLNDYKTGSLTAIGLILVSGTRQDFWRDVNETKYAWM